MIINHYKLVYVSLFSLITALAVILALNKLPYFKKYPNRFYFLSLIILSIPPIISILRPGTYESGDLSLHAIGIFSMAYEIQNGNLIPSWASHFNFNYGSPYHEFMYFLPRLIPALISVTGISLLNSLKIFLITTYILSGIFMYLFVKKEFGIKAAFISGLFYLYAPWHLVDLHYRVALGELLAYTILPVLLIFTQNFLTKKNILNYISLSLIFLILILTHQPTSAIVIPFVFSYGTFLIFKNKLTKKNILYLTSSLITGILLSSFYLIPIIFEKQYILFSTFNHIPHLIPIKQLIFTPWRYGLLLQNNQGNLSFIFGYIHIIIILASLSILIFKLYEKKLKLYFIYYLLCILAIILFMIPQSGFIWKNLEILRGFESSYRFLLLINFTTSILAGLVYLNTSKIIDGKKHIKNKMLVFKNSKNIKDMLLIILSISVIGVSILNWGNRRNIPEISEDSYFENSVGKFPIEFGGSDYTQPIFVKTESDYFRRFPKSKLEAISGNAIVSNLKTNSTYHKFWVDVRTPTTFRENTFYFPGWHLYVNNQKAKINYSYPGIEGIITFKLNPGKYYIELKYEDTFYRILGKIISFTTVVFLVIFILFTPKKKIL